MPEQFHHEKARVTVEHLVSLKRSEKPQPEFWEGFEKEFQRRRLAALVQTTPWYVEIGRVMTRAAKVLAPLAAATAVAVFALTHFANPPASAPEQPAPQVAASHDDPTLTILAEEYLSHAAPRQELMTEVAAAEPYLAWENLDYKVREIEMLSATPQRFVTVAAPHVLAVSDEVSGGYPIRTLTASPALSLDAPVSSASF